MLAIQYPTTNLLTWRGQTVQLFPRRAQYFVYLIHFKTPYYHARHYLGSSMCIEARLLAHEQGRGARLMEVISQAGIEWELARLWPCESEPEMRQLEKHFKHRHNSWQICPICTPALGPCPLVMPRAGHYPFQLFDKLGRRRPLR